MADKTKELEKKLAASTEENQQLKAQLAAGKVSKDDVVVTSKYKVPAEVNSKFDIVNWTGGHEQVFGKFGTVNLEKLTLVQAERLFSNGFTKLKRK